MNTLERLKILYKERYLEHFDIDAWHDAIDREWPIIEAVLDAATRRDLPDLMIAVEALEAPQ